MFWMWNEQWRFMDTEPGHHESQTEALSQRLMGLTFWGDYGGDTLSRFNYTVLLENCSNVVQVINHSHGQSLALGSIGEHTEELRLLIQFLAYFDPESSEFGDYPVNEYLGSYSDWEFELTQIEMTTGWWAEYMHGELETWFADWEGNTIVPERFSHDWSKLVDDYCSKNDWEGVETYWESADSLVVTGWGTEEVVLWLLARYAEEISIAGNPPELA